MTRTCIFEPCFILPRAIYFCSPSLVEFWPNRRKYLYLKKKKKKETGIRIYVKEKRIIMIVNEYVFQ